MAQFKDYYFRRRKLGVRLNASRTRTCFSCHTYTAFGVRTLDLSLEGFPREALYPCSPTFSYFFPVCIGRSDRTKPLSLTKVGARVCRYIAWISTPHSSRIIYLGILHCYQGFRLSIFNIIDKAISSFALNGLITVLCMLCEDFLSL
jgi:hypothetical protein